MFSMRWLQQQGKKAICAYSTTSWTLPEENAQTWQAELALTLQSQSSSCVHMIG